MDMEFVKQEVSSNCGHGAGNNHIIHADISWLANSYTRILAKKEELIKKDLNPLPTVGFS